MKKFLVIATVILLNGCSATGEKVLSRADGLSSRPSWAKETVAYFEDNGVSYFVGNQVVEGDMSPAWVCMAASNMAKKDVSDIINQKLDFLMQMANEDMKVGVAQMKYVGTEATNITMSNLRKDGCYWEKVLTQTDTNENSVQYRAFTKLSIPTSQLKAAIKNAGAKKGLSEDFKKQVDERWNLMAQ